MAMFRHVAGVGNVEMTPEEEAAIKAEWKANEEVTKNASEEGSPVAKLTAFLNANPDVKALIEG